MPRVPWLGIIVVTISSSLLSSIITVQKYTNKMTPGVVKANSKATIFIASVFEYFPCEPFTPNYKQSRLLQQFRIISKGTITEPVRGA